MKPSITRQAAERLKMRREALIADYLAGNCPDFLVRHAQLIDDYFWESFEHSSIGPQMGMSRNPYAIIALGGYGRMEQCIHSDVDILFLFEEAVPGFTEQLVQELIYPLWDIGLEVGHATRTIGECVELASQNLEVLTAVLDARFICGMSTLFLELSDSLRARFVSIHPRKIMSWLIDGNRNRHAQFGDSTHLLEPNLKLGQGGLRDYHTMLWLGRVKFDLKDPRDLEYNGFLSQDEYTEIRDALDFIWKVRNHLHFLTRRKCDQLHFEHQVRLAETLGFLPENGMTAVECFLGHLHQKMDLVKQHLLMQLDEVGHEQRLGLKRKYVKTTRIEGLEIRSGMLGFTGTEAVLANPELLLLLFQESGAKKLPLSSEAKRIAKEMGYLIDEKFRRRKRVVKCFEKIMTTPPFAYHPLNEMQNTGILQHLIPEFARIISRIQYNEYHLYPVAKHSLRTVQNVATFALPPGESDAPGSAIYPQTFKEVRNRRLLYWAALLHDIGKGVQTDDHAGIGADITRKILTRMGLRSDHVETVAFLVKHHLTLIKTATRRDINDEETIANTAMEIRDPERLKLLFLLTVADSLSTGPKAWNGWTSSLLTSLFVRTLNMLEKGDLAGKTAIAQIEKKRLEVLTGSREEEMPQVARSLKLMPPSYLLEVPADDIRAHIRLHQERGTAPFAWEILEDAAEGVRTVLVCGDDRPGFFSKVAATFTLNGIDILDVRAYGWTDGKAMNRYTVEAPKDRVFEEEIWKKAAEDLDALLAGELETDRIAENPVLPHLKKGLPATPHKVRIDNESSSFYTIVEVHTYDFAGILFRITGALFDCGLDVKSAKIATKMDQVVDVFYLRDLEGRKTDTPEQEERIRDAILDILPAL